MSKAKFSSADSGDSVKKLLVRGTELLHRGDAEQAARLLEKAYELDSLNPDVALNLGGAYILQKKFGQAVAILEPLSQLEPYNAMVWTNLGAAYLGNPILARDEEHEKAIAAFERALEINPVAPNVAYNLGLIFRDRREYERAKFWFQQAIQANPHDQDARQLLARLMAMDEEE
ncbi:MAG: tetratricopeptide repeat protein [Ardenticatenaceae bacterium]|nr:tetratricopeptide repeat protein [Anaerolineales bacterium]MCB8982507.1 tetratricopeptide repeat protein [Ardenticatenaceae bacterium]MCB8988352.1 tetratricopeptide repeat protein [Ardenticatenaceae bacterium]